MSADPRRYLGSRSDAEVESARLRLLETCRDPGTIARLTRVGVAAGWRCLEVGAGCGSIARWLAERVGPGGSVVAADVDTRLLGDLPATIEVRELDIREDGVEADRYDLVHCRAVLMHLPDPAAALRRMVAALRPGGVLLVEEGDYGLINYAGHPDAERLTELVPSLMNSLADMKIMDGWLGRRLPGLVAASGVRVDGGQVESSVALPGSDDYEFEAQTALAAAANMAKLGLFGRDECDLVERFFSSSSGVVTTMSVVAVWGRRVE